MLIKIKELYAELLLFLLIISAFAFRGFVASSDGASSWFSPLYNLQQNFFVWDTYSVPGSSSPISFTSFFLRLFYASIDFFTHNAALTQKLSWIIFFEAVGFLIFKLIEREYSFSKVESLFTTIFILFNPISQYFLWGKQHWAYYLVAIYFIAYFFYKKYIDSRNTIFLYLISFLWFICGFAFNQPAYFAPWGLFIFFIFINSFIFSKEKIVLFKQNLKFLLFFILLNAIYFVPLLSGGVSQIQASQQNYASGDPIPILHDLSSLNFFLSFLDIADNQTNAFSLNLAILVLWTGFFCLSFYLVFFKKNSFGKRDYQHLRITIFFLLFLIFFNKGISNPLPSISRDIYSLKVLYIFRDFKDKLALGFSMAVSILSIFFIKSKINLIKYFIFAITALSYFSFVYNFWLPSSFIFSNDLSYLNSAKFPDTSISRVLNLPLVNYSFFYTYDPSYSGDSPLKNIFHRDVLYTTNQQLGSIMDVKNDLDSGVVSPPAFEDFLKNNNIEYILNNKNSYAKEDQYPYAYDYRILGNFSFLQLIQDTDKFQIYEFLDYLPRIYGNNVTFQQISPAEYKIYIKNIGISDDRITLIDSFNSNWSMYIVRDPSSDWCITLKAYQNVDTDECTSNTPFISSILPDLNLGRSIFAGSIIDKSMSPADLTKNSWNLNSQIIEQDFNQSYYKLNPDGTVDVEVYLYFKQQLGFLYGMIISIFTIVIFLLYGIYLLKKEKFSATSFWLSVRE